MKSETRYEQEGKLISDNVTTRATPNPYYGGVNVQTIDNGTTYETETGPDGRHSFTE